MRGLLAALIVALLASARAEAPVVEQSVVGKPLREFAHVRVAFSPGDNIAAIIIEEIRAAQSDIRIQAYLFTSKNIADALARALKRGIRIEVIADAGEFQNGNASALPRLAQLGAIIYLNDKYRSSHNKIVIVDADSARATVVTGSYNFTRAAQTQNAENIVVISGNREIAQRFLKNWEFHRARSIPLK